MAYPLEDKYISLLTDFGFKRVFGNEPSLKYYRDLNNVVNTSRQEGRAEGQQEEQALNLQRQRSLLLRLLIRQLGELDSTIRAQSTSSPPTP